MLEDEDTKNEIAGLFESENAPDVITIYELDLKTGKKHQIRAHLSGIMNTPILFDKKYGFNTEDVQNKNVRDFLLGFQNEVLPAYFDNKYGDAAHSSSQEMQKYGTKLDYKIKKNSLEQDSNWFFLHARKLKFQYKGQDYQFEANFSDHFNVFMKYLGLGDKLNKF